MLTFSEIAGMSGLARDKMLTYAARGGRIWMGDITFDSSYPIGGESAEFPWDIDAARRNDLSRVTFEQPISGYSFQFDHTNKKIRVLQPGKSLIVEEAVTVASNAGQLAHKPFYILSIEVTAGTTTGPFSVIPTGETPLTTQCAVTFTTGALAFLAGDAVTAVRVTYIPLHESGPFSSANLVVDEAVTAAAAKAELANRAAAVQYVWDDTDGILDVLEPVGEAPTATHNAVVDITNATPTTDIDFHADDEANAIKVTYIKYGAFPAFAQLGDGDITLAGADPEAYGFTENHYHGLAIPGLGTALVGEATATNVALIWSGPSGTVGAGVPVLNVNLNKWETQEATAITTLAVPVILMDPTVDGIHLMEVANGEDLSSVIAKAIAWRIDA
ncbi:MAG: hypothetical protein ACXADB_00540 [Candidatus Hermodarchaeia archaeon]|jgi:hypothetical protein